MPSTQQAGKRAEQAGGPGKAASRASGDRGAVGGPGSLLRLQGSIGNRAVSRLVTAPRPVATVQRDLANATYPLDVSPADRMIAEAFFNAFDKAVGEAYKFVVSVPSLGAYADLDGHTRLWAAKWAEFVSGGRPKLMAATFGYVIESLVSDERSTELRPTAPPGYSIAPQQTYGGTRPDLVLRLKKGGTDLAWLDLTASGSADHIFEKEGWDKKIKIFAEVTYPSLDPGTLTLMVKNKANTSTLTQEEFDKRKEAAKALYQVRKASWVKMGREQYSSAALANPFHAYVLARLRHQSGDDEIGRDRMLRHKRLPGIRTTLSVHPDWPTTFIRRRLEAGFKSGPIDEKLVPSILAAMRVSPTSWGFVTGTNSSERAGEAWLVDNDPSVVTEEEAVEEEAALDLTPVAPEDRKPGGGKMKTKRPKKRNPYDR